MTRPSPAPPPASTPPGRTPPGGRADADGAAATDADVLVIGAGAAGLLAALAAGRAGARVLLLEGSARVGTKIRASGGGRCNILPSRARDDGFFSHSDAKAMAQVLARWPLPQVRAFFERDLRLPLRDEAADKVFPASGRADDVVQALLAGVAAAGVTLRTDARVAELRGFGGHDAGGEVQLVDGTLLRARRAIVCAGGLALPRSGSDGWGLQLAEALGHTIEPTYPALVPLSVDASDLRALSGVSLPVRMRVVGPASEGGRELAREDGDLLLTHRGLSGPAVLQISRHLTDPRGRGRRLELAWGATDWPAALADGRGGRTLGQALRAELPNRLAEALLERLAAGKAGATAATVAADRLAGLSRNDRAATLALLTRFGPVVTGSEGYKTAEVMAGGVALTAIDPRTLASRSHPGLHFAGEVLDVTGRLGGFNFLWAWVSGKVAGEAAAAGAARG